MMSVKKVLVAVAAVVLLPAVAPAQQVFKDVSNQKLEDILKGLNISYSKGSDNNKTWYDYTSKTYKLRLWNYNGKDLMIDVFLPKAAWEEVNKWNGTAKFSRARLFKDNSGQENTIIESNLDIMGGVTEETIRHFIIGFDLEVDRWAKNVANLPPPKDNPPPGGGAVVNIEETYNKVTAERLEKVLNGLNIKFKKQQGKGTNTIYDYERNGFKVRLVNFGGDDLMIDCIYPSVPLTKVNEWNLKRSYIRAVHYAGNGNPYTALESNLDCVAGTNDNIIRWFINAFDQEVKEFDQHLKGGK